ADVVADHLAEVAQAQHDVANAVVAQQLELVVDEGPAGDLDEGLGDLRSDGAKPGGEAAGEDGGGGPGKVEAHGAGSGGRGGASWYALPVRACAPCAAAASAVVGKPRRPGWVRALTAAAALR